MLSKSLSVTCHSTEALTLTAPKQIAAFLTTHSRDRGAHFERLVPHWLNTSRNFRSVTAFLNGEVIGFLAVGLVINKETGELFSDLVGIHRLVVHPAHRQQKVGSEMLQGILGELSGEPSHNQVLIEAVQKNNHTVRAFFERNGFNCTTSSSPHCVQEYLGFVHEDTHTLYWRKTSLI